MLKRAVSPVEMKVNGFKYSTMRDIITLLLNQYEEKKRGTKLTEIASNRVTITNDL